MSDHYNIASYDLTYLAQQSHLSRCLLIGTGIVCGFEICVQENQCTFKLSQGIGICSDGTLVQTSIASYHFTHYRPYQPPRDYSLFRDTAGGLFPVWEVLEGRDSEMTAGIRALTPQNPHEKNRLFIEGKILLIFLEPNDTQTPFHTPRFLLMRQQDLLRSLELLSRVRLKPDRHIMDPDYLYSEAYSQEDDRLRETDILCAQYPELELREIQLRRFGFGCLDPFDCSPEELDAAGWTKIYNLDDIYREYVCIIDAATKELDREMRKVHELLLPTYCPSEKQQLSLWLNQLCEKWEAFKKLNTLEDSSRHKKENVQYFHDWCRDLIQAYHELRREILQFLAECLPDKEAFPRHLLLGLVNRAATARYPAALRHHFRQPPIYNGNAERQQQIKSLHWRFLMMVKGFYLLDSIPEKTLNPYCVLEECGDREGLPDFSMVKITPGRFYHWSLNLQAIPFYYLLTQSRYSLHRFWDYFRTRTLRTRQLLSYHANDSEESYSSLPHVIRPLRFNIDRKGFYRIEGHIGKSCAEAEAAIRALLKKYDLCIDLLVIRPEEIRNLAFHRGFHHWGGAAEGQTFVLVCDWITRQKWEDCEPGLPEVPTERIEAVVADFTLPCLCCPPKLVVCRQVKGQIIECFNKEGLAGVKVKIDGGVIAQTDANGYFEASISAWGRSRMQIEYTDYLPFEMDFTLKEIGVTDLGVIVLFFQFGRLAGLVCKAPNIPLAWVKMTVLGTDLSVESLNDGSFVLDLVPTGWQRIGISGVDHHLEIKVEECQVTRLMLFYTTSKVIDCTDSPICDAAVQITNLEMGWEINTYTIDNGVFEAYLVPGKYHLFIEDDENNTYERNFEVKPDTLSLDDVIKLHRRTATLRGLLHDNYGNPVMGGQSRYEGISEAVYSREDGSFVLPEIPIGSHELTVTLNEGWVLTYPVSNLEPCEVRSEKFVVIRVPGKVTECDKKNLLPGFKFEYWPKEDPSNRTPYFTKEDGTFELCFAEEMALVFDLPEDQLTYKLPEPIEVEVTKNQPVPGVDLNVKAEQFTIRLEVEKYPQSNIPLEGIVLRIPDTDLVATTDAEGKVALSGVPIGPTHFELVQLDADTGNDEFVLKCPVYVPPDQPDIPPDVPPPVSPCQTIDHGRVPLFVEVPVETTECSGEDPLGKVLIYRNDKRIELTGEDGKGVVLLTPKQIHNLEARKSGYESSAQLGFSFEKDSNPLLPFNLKAVDFTYKGQIYSTEEEQQPLVGARVSIVNQNVNAFTNEEGRYELEGVQQFDEIPNKIEVIVDGVGQEFPAIKGDCSTVEQETIYFFVPVVLNVIDCLNQVVTDANVQLGPFTGTLVQGDFYKFKVAPGQGYELRVETTRSHPFSRQDIQIAAPIELEPVQILLNTVDLTGVLINTTREPLVGIRISISDSSDVETTTNANGNFTLKGVPENTAQLRIHFAERFLPYVLPQRLDPCTEMSPLEIILGEEPGHDPEPGLTINIPEDTQFPEDFDEQRVEKFRVHIEEHVNTNISAFASSVQGSELAEDASIQELEQGLKESNYYQDLTLTQSHQQFRKDIKVVTNQWLEVSDEKKVELAGLIPKLFAFYLDSMLIRKFERPTDGFKTSLGILKDIQGVDWSIVVQDIKKEKGDFLSSGYAEALEQNLLADPHTG